LKDKKKGSQLSAVVA